VQRYRPVEQSALVVAPFGQGRFSVQAGGWLGGSDDGQRLSLAQGSLKLGGVDVVFADVALAAELLDGQVEVFVPVELGRQGGPVAEQVKRRGVVE